MTVKKVQISEDDPRVRAARAIYWGRYEEAPNVKLGKIAQIRFNDADETYAVLDSAGGQLDGGTYADLQAAMDKLT